MYLYLPALVTVFYASAISCYKDRLPHGIRFVGCFTNAFSRHNENGIEINPLTWEVCIRVCIEKDVRYAGVESGVSTCYCGNNLAQQSEKVAPYMCDEECFADKSKTCGGDNNLLSLYQIKNTTTFSFLVTTDTGLAYLKNNALSANFARVSSVSTITAAYHYAENTVYYHANRKIYKSKYIPLLKEHYVQELVELQEKAFSLALDWIHTQLFWALRDSIVKSNLDGSNRQVLAETDHPALDLTVDPYDRKLFFINNGTVKRLDLKSNKIGNKNLFKNNRFKLVTNLAVDLHKKVVYAIGYYDVTERGDKYLVSTDYEGVMFRALLRRRELTGAFSISALNDQVFWAEFTAKTHQRALYLYKVPINNVFTAPKKLSSLAQNVVGAVLYHEDAQTPGETYFCQKIKCSHICTYNLATSAKCDCPQLMMLGKDHKTCKDIPGLSDLKTDGDDSDEFDDEIFDLSIDLSSKEKSKSSKRKSHSSHKKSKKKERKSKHHKKSKHSRSKNNSTKSKIKSRSLPFIWLVQPTNSSSVNTTTFKNTTTTM